MTPDEHIVRELFAAVDAGNIETALGFMTEDVAFRFGSFDPAVGHAGFATAAATMGQVVA